MKKLYNQTYYKSRYLDPLLFKLKINNLYYLWIAYFCIIRKVRLNKGAKILDFGCGVGNLVWALRFLGMRAFGVDSSVDAGQFCRIPRYCSYKPTEKLPYKDSSFDLVISNEVLEHLHQHELPKYLREMQRVSNGTMIHMICVEERGDIVFSDATHVLIKSEDWWQATFEKLGFRVKRGCLFYFFPTVTYVFSGALKLSSICKGYFFLHKNK